MALTLYTDLATGITGDTGGFANRYDPPRRLLIVGAVQIAQVLAGLARELGVAVHAPDRAMAVVTLSHDPKLDDPAQAAALRSGAGYVGALGSPRSHAARLERLRGMGFDDMVLARIDGPAGLDIGAVGPAEIALSIAAGMVRSFNDDRG